MGLHMRDDADIEIFRVMTDWPDLPMTLSSALEGYRLEMYSRLDQRITINDMLDRMPSAQDGSRAVVCSQFFYQAVLTLLGSFCS